MNRKNRFSINTQVVCNQEAEITNIVARWAGSSHDSRIFNDSKVKHDIETLIEDGTWLLGDGGYTCVPYLMTPLGKIESRAEARYNKAQKRGRNIIERLFGMWKRRFPCLTLLRTKVSTTFAIIIACAVLWNISRRRNEPDIDADIPEEIPGDDVPHAAAPEQLSRLGKMRRQKLIRDHFTR